MEYRSGSCRVYFNENGELDEYSAYNFIVPRLPSDRPNEDKYRRLPCRTYISTGTCPYRERCVYLHDPRIMSKNVKSRSRRKNKEDVISDSLFWPVMTDAEMQLDQGCQPIVNQQYNVPPPLFEQSSIHNRSVYSMWMHFVEFCIELFPKSPERSRLRASHSQYQVFCHPNVVSEFQSGKKEGPSFVNIYTGQKRMSVFILLGNGESIVPVDEIASEEGATLPLSSTKCSVPFDGQISSDCIPSSLSLTFSDSKKHHMGDCVEQVAPVRGNYQLHVAEVYYSNSVCTSSHLQPNIRSNKGLAKSVASVSRWGSSTSVGLMLPVSGLW